MFKKSAIKKLTIVLVALLVFTVALLTACSPSAPFKQRTIPTHVDEVQGNGGIAVKYGDWIYYVNGNISGPSTANNSYTEDLRSGAIVRIKVENLEELITFSAAQMDMSSTEKAKELEAMVRKYAEMVVPNVYYTASTNYALNGIYIFNDRIYITTPNDQLDNKGNVLTNQLVLTSYNLGGGDRQKHVVFESNAPQLKLAQVGNDVYATYVLDNNLMSYKIGEKEPATIAEKVSSVQFSGNYVHYLDEDGSICRFQIGATEATVLVKLDQPEGHEDHNHKSYAIQKVYNQYVYYTINDSESLNYPEVTGQVLFYATEPVEKDTQNVLIDAIPSSTYFCYETNVVYTMADEDAPDDQTRYKIVCTSGTGETVKELRNERASITILKIEDGTLYYSYSGVTYTLDLTNDQATAIPYAADYSLSASGWAYPDVLSFGEGDNAVSYKFVISTGTINVYKFNRTTKKNGTSTNITLVAESKDED